MVKFFAGKQAAPNLPDIILLLVITSVLSVLTLVARLIFWRQAASTHAQTAARKDPMK